MLPYELEIKARLLLSESGKYQIFSGNEENLNKNGATLLEERISLFNGRTNSIRCFSVDDLNSMILDKDQITATSIYDCGFRGVWDGKLVYVKVNDGVSRKFACREIAVATEMGTHRNVHRLLGCCLHTKSPVLVYEWEEKGTLKSRITNLKGHSKEILEWKDRLRIAWEIAHAVAYLHTAFDLPIVHRCLKPENVYLDQDDSVRLSGFSLCISIPAGKKDVEDAVIGTWSYAAPDYMISGRVAESSDVYSFGAILLVLLTGKFPSTIYHSNQGRVSLSEWVAECHAVNCLADVVDPTITRNGPIADEVHLKEIVELALSCSAADGECRPTMVDVATQLKDIIISSSDSR
ncbi:non-functional pseudokinase ZED1-like isoform X2 [Silene latifolia]|uniref:non-functional pseudokinase ZED1-like isoform X2 n=1 Tax=Silene latifolia TaxID=37657 RepID=UPI003D77CDC0